GSGRKPDCETSLSADRCRQKLSRSFQTLTSRGSTAHTHMLVMTAGPGPSALTAPHVLLECGPRRQGGSAPGPTGCSSAWLERYVRDVEVAGSNPVTPIFAG